MSLAGEVGASHEGDRRPTTDVVKIDSDIPMALLRRGTGYLRAERPMDP